MHFKTWMTKAIFLAALAVAASAAASTRETTADIKVELVGGKEAAAGEVLVRFRTTPASLDLAKLDREHDADKDEEIADGLRLLHSRSKGAAALVRDLSARADVAYAEPNYVVRMVSGSSVPPNDPYFGELWALQNTGQSILGVSGKAGADISALSAWEITTGSTTNVVGVIDTGVDYNHPALAANIWSAPSRFTVTIGGQKITCAAGTHGFNAITNTCDPTDDNYHGTHVSGTIGAVGNDGIGVVGVNWTTRIIGLKFLNAFGTGSMAAAIKAMEFAMQVKSIFGAAANIRVLSNSWGGGGYSQALFDEISKANANNMLFVAAAGNAANDNDVNAFYPSGYNVPNVVSVAATDNSDKMAGFSNFGANTVHLGAPGVYVLSTVTGGLYEYFSGTSMATPHVSGAAALVLSACPLSTAGLKNELLKTVDPIPSMQHVTSTGGRLNVSNAVRACSGALVSVRSASVSGGVQPGVVNPNDCESLSVTLHNDGVGSATGVTGTLTTTTPGVTVLQSSSTFPDVAPGGTAVNTSAFRIRTDASLQGGTNIDFTLTLGYSGRSGQTHFSLPVGGAGAPARVDNGIPLPVPDYPAPAVESTVDVSGIAGPIANVTVSFYLTHTFDSDLTISLVSPDGTEVVLVQQEGGAGHNFGSACSPDSSRTTLSDSAAVPIAAAAAPFIGTYRPDRPLAGFTGKSGAAANGTWRLRVLDNQLGDVGTVQCWSLQISAFGVTQGASCTQ